MGRKRCLFCPKDINSIINRSLVIDDIPFVVDSVLAGSAKQAGLKKGDILNSVNGEVFMEDKSLFHFSKK